MYSIVIATFNRAPMLAATLESLLAQEAVPTYEIIVVDNNSSDDTARIVRAFAQRTSGKVRYLFEATMGTSVARNAGIAIARGAVIAFTDDDVVASPDWLAALGRTFRRHPEAWCVGGKIVLQLPPAWPAWFNPTSRVLPGQLSFLDFGDDTKRLDYPHALTGANLSVTRQALARVGLFDTRFGHAGSRLGGGEDHDLCYRIQRSGGAVYYCGTAMVTHVVPRARMTKSFFRRKAYGHGRGTAPTIPRGERWRAVVHLGSNVMKDWVKMCAHYTTGDVSRAFDHEVTAWLWSGRLRQILLDPRGSGTAPTTNGGSLSR